MDMDGGYLPYTELFYLLGSSRNTLCKSLSLEHELYNSTVTDEFHECRGVTPSRGIHRRNTNDSNCGSLIERSMEEQPRKQYNLSFFLELIHIIIILRKWNQLIITVHSPSTETDFYDKAPAL